MTKAAPLLLAAAALIVAVAALAVAVAALNKETPISVLTGGWALYGDGGLPPAKDLPGAYTQWYVDQAVQLYKDDGREAMEAHYNDPASIDGEWYMFVINEEGKTFVHYRPEIRFRDPAERVDVRGYYYGPDILSATESGKWVSYYFLNPETGEENRKHTWVKEHDGLIFGSGWYER